MPFTRLIKSSEALNSIVERMNEYPEDYAFQVAENAQRDAVDILGVQDKKRQAERQRAREDNIAPVEDKGPDPNSVQYDEKGYALPLDRPLTPESMTEASVTTGVAPEESNHYAEMAAPNISDHSPYAEMEAPPTHYAEMTGAVAYGQPESRAIPPDTTAALFSINEEDMIPYANTVRCYVDTSQTNPDATLTQIHNKSSMSENAHASSQSSATSFLLTANIPLPLKLTEDGAELRVGQLPEPPVMLASLPSLRGESKKDLKTYGQNISHSINFMASAAASQGKGLSLGYPEQSYASVSAETQQKARETFTDAVIKVAKQLPGNLQGICLSMAGVPESECAGLTQRLENSAKLKTPLLTHDASTLAPQLASQDSYSETTFFTVVPDNMNDAFGVSARNSHKTSQTEDATHLERASMGSVSRLFSTLQSGHGNLTNPDQYVAYTPGKNIPAVNATKYPEAKATTAAFQMRARGELGLPQFSFDNDTPTPETVIKPRAPMSPPPTRDGSPVNEGNTRERKGIARHGPKRGERPKSHAERTTNPLREAAAAEAQSTQGNKEIPKPSA